MSRRAHGLGWNYPAGAENDPAAPWNIPADDRPSCHSCEDRPSTDDEDGLCDVCREEAEEQREAIWNEYQRQREDDYPEPDDLATEALIDRADEARKERKEER